MILTFVCTWLILICTLFQSAVELVFFSSNQFWLVTGIWWAHVEWKGKSRKDGGRHVEVRGKICTYWQVLSPQMHFLKGFLSIQVSLVYFWLLFLFITRLQHFSFLHLFCFFFFQPGHCNLIPFHVLPLFWAMLMEMGWKTSQPFYHRRNCSPKQDEGRKMTNFFWTGESQRNLHDL